MSNNTKLPPKADQHRAEKFAIVFSIIFFGVLFFAKASLAATYYVDYSTGSDSNSGLSKSSPWKGHPFMSCFAGSYTHQAGDRFIFKGGVIWPNVCFQMTISIGGSAGNVDYYTVDQTWYTGGSWSRPVFDLQQTVLASGYDAIRIQNGASYITIDNIEIRNLKFSGTGTYGQALIWLDMGSFRSTNVTVRNCYLHSWYKGTLTTTDSANAGGIIAVVTSHAADNTVVEYCTIENSAGGGDIGALHKGWGIVRYNIMHDAPNGSLSAEHFIGNEIYNIRNSFDPNAHENGVFMMGRGIVAHNYIYGFETPSFHGVPVFLDPAWSTEGYLYVYDNVIYGTSDKVPVVFTNDVRAYNPDPHIYFWNNTVVTSVEVCGRVAPDIHHLELRNNHCIQDDTWNGVWYNGHRGEGYVANLVDDHNLMMTHAIATNQGYILSNKYTPTSGIRGTVNVGTPLTCSSCNPTLAEDILGVSRPQGSAWDIGAYEYSGAGPTTYTFTVAKAGTGSGTVTGAGISCGSDCSETINSGTSVTLTAAANSGSTFVGWSGGGCSGTGSCTITMNSNITLTATFNLTTTDTQAPTVPANLSALAVSSSQINLTWSASTDPSPSSGLAGYRIYRCSGSGCTPSTQLTTVTGTSYQNTGLTANTTYVYRVAAYDAAGNVSSQSSSASATTQAASVSGNIEAESGTLVSPMQIVSDTSASGNAYIQTTTGESGTAVYSFNIATAGAYKIVARVYAQNGGTDSFYVKVDNLTEDTWDLNPTGVADQFNFWREDEVTKRGTGTFDLPQYDPYTINLTAGNHTITFRGRETSARLDYFRLVNIGTTDTTPPSPPTGVRVN